MCEVHQEVAKVPKLSPEEAAAALDKLVEGYHNARAENRLLRRKLAAHSSGEVGRLRALLARARKQLDVESHPGESWLDVLHDIAAELDACPHHQE